LTTLILTPLATASFSIAITSPGMPFGSTATVKSTWTEGSAFCSAASAWLRRVLALLLASVSPSMSKSSRLTPGYVLSTFRYAPVSDETLVQVMASSPPASPPNEMMTLPPASCSCLTLEVNVLRAWLPFSHIGVQPLLGVRNASV
jgi:hypothetical protein